MNFRNPHEFETLSEKMIRLILSHIKGTPEYAARLMEKYIDYIAKK